MKNLKDLYRTEDLYTGYKELDDALDELTEFRVIGRAQRRKIALRMKRLVKSAAFKKKVERSKLRVASPEKIRVKAAKLAKQKVIDKYYPKYKQMGLAQRIKIDQLIQQKYSGMINKLTMKLARVVKKKEIEKVKKARMAKQNA